MMLLPIALHLNASPDTGYCSPSHWPLRIGAPLAPRSGIKPSATQPRNLHGQQIVAGSYT